MPTSLYPHGRKRPPAPRAAPSAGLLLAVAASLLAAPAISHSRPTAGDGSSAEAPGLASPAPRPPLRDPGSTVDRSGERIFYSREETPIRIACADCHAVTPAGTPPDDDRIRPGHTVYDAFSRGNWWNGRVTTDCGEAGEVCLKRFMGGAEMSGKMRTHLVVYMKSLGPPWGSPFVLHRRPPGMVAADSGNPGKGRDLFRRACDACHPGGGAGQGPDLSLSTMTPREIADLIRVGSDPMPFYQGDILSDDEVADIAAFTRTLQPAKSD